MHGLPAQGSFDDPQAEKVLRKVKEGKLSKAKASRILNVSRQTIYKWLRTIKDPKEEDKSELIKDRNRFRNDVARIITSNPRLGPKKISGELRKRGLVLSNRSVWLLLKDSNLQTKEKREEYSYKFRKPFQARDLAFPGHLRLEAPARKRMVEEVLLAGRKVKEVTKEHGVSRKTFAKWKKRYQKASEVGKDILKELSDQHPQGSRHPKGASEKKIKAVLGQAASNPELSSQKIAEKLRFLGNHGVQNILKRNNLNKYEMRLAYSKARKEVSKPVFARFLDRIRLVWEQFIPSLAPAPPPRSVYMNVARLLRTFFLSSLLTLIIASAGFNWARFLGRYPVSVRVGLIFAGIALFMGSVFFLYSLKYYLTLAIVLSFSQAETGKRQEVKGKRRGIINWLLGTGNGDLKSLKETKSQAVGLTPNLEHVVLKRHPYVSIHIPFYNEKRVVERAIAAATNFDYPNYEVILCDDSTDETSDIIRRYQESFGKLRTSRGDGWILTSVEVRPGVTVKHLHRTTRSGYKGGALRLALRMVNPRTEFVSVFDADFVPYPDTLELFLKYFQATAGTLDFKKDIKRLSDEEIKKNKNSITQSLNHSITSPIAAVQGYQWHVLNKSENWITRGVRSEYAGSYVIERSGEEIYSGLKQISGAVYMIRRDVLEEVGWETSITEDFQLTLKLYDAGYKVVYTPYIQAPAECVSTLKRLIRQRMRWAEGHSNNIRRMFFRLMVGKWEPVDSGQWTVSSGSKNTEHRTPNTEHKQKFVPSPLTLPEKLEFLYLSPYYLQAFFFLVGTVSWLVSETLLPAQLPFWTSLWGWSLVLTNFISLPLMNTVGLFLEESEERDYQGIMSFIALSYIMVPFQAYASLKGFFKGEGPWFRTPKTGHITDVFQRGRFYRFISGILPGRTPAVAQVRANQPLIRVNPYFALSSANNQFNSFSIKSRKKRWVGKVVLSTLLALTVSVYSYTKGVPEVLATTFTTLYVTNTDCGSGCDEAPSLTGAWALQTTNPSDNTGTVVTVAKNGPSPRIQRYVPGSTNTTVLNEQGTGCTSDNLAPSGEGWVFDKTFTSNGSINSGTWTFYISETDSNSAAVGYVLACPYVITISGGSIATSDLLNQSGSDTAGVEIPSSGDTWDNADSDVSAGETFDAVSFNNDEYLYVEYFNYYSTRPSSEGNSTFEIGPSNTTRIETPLGTVPEKVIIFLFVSPFLPFLVNNWMKKKRERLAYV